MKIEKLD